MVEIASNIGVSGKEVELGEKTEHEQDVTEAFLVLELVQKEEKTSLDQNSVELIVEKTGKIKVSDYFKWSELKQDIGEEKDVSMHETEISVAEDASIKGVELDKDAGLEKMSPKLCLLLMKKKMFWCMKLRFLLFPSSLKKERRGLYLSQESIKENWKISKLV